MTRDITQLLAEWKRGNAEAGEALIARTYHELHRIAHHRMRQERSGHALQTTDLLNEACVRLFRVGPGPVTDREDFFRLMAAEMRRRLIDHARRRAASKRGSGVPLTPLDSSVVAASSTREPDSHAALDALDEALRKLADSFPRAADVVQLRFLAGLTTEETARVLGVSTGTVKREWTFARAWLTAALQSENSNRN